MFETYVVTVACATGSATLAVFARDARCAAALLVGFLPPTAFVLSGLSVEPAVHGICVAFWAGTLLAKPHLHVTGAVGAGVLAALGAAQATSAGAPAAAAIGAFALIPAASATFSARRRTFAPAPLREEALLIVLGMGVIAAATPILSNGWRTARALQTRTGALEVQTPPYWVMGIAALALGAGVSVSLGRQR